jgi:molecular chaperone HtpG
MATHKFQTEANQLLSLMIHSLYSNKEIFLRELISNASDALDKLRYLSLTDDNLKGLEFEPKVIVTYDENDKSVSIIDNGIGMNEEDLMNNIGTIAKSGTKSFIENLTGDSKKDSNLIGQFGVGFYSAFMVAERIDVITKKAGCEEAYKWSSKGDGEFDISEVTKESHGTVIYMKLKDGEEEFLSNHRLESLIKKYSDHVAFPINLMYTTTETLEQSEEDKKAGKEPETKEVKKNEQINSAAAIWTQAKSDLKKEDYIEFYKTIAHTDEEPFNYVHTKAEGTLEYNTLFYLPKKAPFDLYRVDYQSNVKLYVNRVFISDDDKELLPTYLRWVKGVIDSSDLPLNVSREILQQNKILETIKQASVKKILGQIKKLQKNEEEYEAFLKEFGRPLKEGLYQDHMNKDALLELVKFKSTNNKEKSTSLAEYVDRMSTDQKAIYYITGDNENRLRNSPLLESFASKGVEVLILDDEVDEIVVPSLQSYKDKEFKSVNRTDTASDLDTKEDEEAKKEAEPIAQKIKDVLGDDVKEVKISSRLQDSPSCIVLDENDPTMQMQQMMRAMGQEMPMDAIKPILEINPNHDIVKKLNDVSDKELESDIARLLFEQALIAEGKVLDNAVEFNKRLNRIISLAI